MKLAIGCDHAGYDYKQAIVDYLVRNGHEVYDKGTHSPDSVDYPDFVHPVANELISGKVDRAIVICGSGNGVAMTINKYAGIRCGLCWNPELVRLTRQHNNANALALPARFVDIEEAVEMVKLFMSTEFEGGRHKRRIDKIDQSSEPLC